MLAGGVPDFDTRDGLAAAEGDSNCWAVVGVVLALPDVAADHGTCSSDLDNLLVVVAAGNKAAVVGDAAADQFGHG